MTHLMVCNQDRLLRHAKLDDVARCVPHKNLLNLLLAKLACALRLKRDAKRRGRKHLARERFTKPHSLASQPQINLIRQIITLTDQRSKAALRIPNSILVQLLRPVERKCFQGKHEDELERVKHDAAKVEYDQERDAVEELEPRLARSLGYLDRVEVFALHHCL